MTTFTPHNSWGNSIWFFNGAPLLEPDKVPLEEMKGYTVTGHKPRSQMPKEDDLLRVEYHKYVIHYRLRDVEVKRDPEDQFFCKADLYKIEDYDGTVHWSHPMESKPLVTAQRHPQ